MLAVGAVLDAAVFSAELCPVERARLLTVHARRYGTLPQTLAGVRRAAIVEAVLDQGRQVGWVARKVGLTHGRISQIIKEVRIQRAEQAAADRIVGPTPSPLGLAGRSNIAAETFGQALRRLRHARGRTQKELAKLSAVSSAYVSQLEREPRLPHPDTTRKLDDALGANGLLVELAGREACGPPVEGLAIERVGRLLLTYAAEIRDITANTRRPVAA